MTANGRPRGRSGADAVLLSALAAGATAGEAAATANVSERTVRRRLADPAFSVLVAEARREVVETTLAKVTAGAVAAVATLVSLLNLDQPPTVRLGATKAVLEFGIRLRSEQEISERLAAIEGHLAISERKTK